jgi:hypothetical protein
MLKEIKVKLNDVEYKVKRSNRAMRFYEEYTKKSVSEITGNLTDITTSFYCILVSNNPDFNLNFEDFSDVLDDNPEAFLQFQSYLIDLSLEVLSDDTDKKKVETSLE